MFMCRHSVNYCNLSSVNLHCAYYKYNNVLGVTRAKFKKN